MGVAVGTAIAVVMPMTAFKRNGPQPKPIAHFVEHVAASYKYLLRALNSASEAREDLASLVTAPSRQ